MARRDDPPGLGRFLEGLEGLISLAREVGEKGGLARSGEIGGLLKGARGTYGMTVKTLAGSSSSSRSPGGKAQPTEPAYEAREPIVDVFDEPDRVVVVAEIPGVSEADIAVEAREDRLTLIAAGVDRNYAKNVALPARIRPGSLCTAYRNGILEISVGKE